MTLEQYFSSYSEYHKTPGNKITHYLGIPLILFSTLGLFALVEIDSGFIAEYGFSLNLGLITWLLGSLFYIKLDWKRGLPFAVFNFALYWLSTHVSWPAHLVLFILGWIFQGIGHYKYEKRSPAFFTNLSHLLIGPFWIFCHFWPFNRN